MPGALLQSIPFEPGLDIVMVAHALQAFIYDSARLLSPNRIGTHPSVSSPTAERRSVG